ncbi:MAG TPA: low specificity L-threonine aldolase [Candidatus Nanoarchaeia archaeon]|nr:low specificity L-threonine aldolase [Candidatus Nanoarchaeia archaeon]
MRHKKGFGSDNHAGVHPDILKAIAEANQGHAHSYGDDDYTQQAIKKFKKLFGNNIEVFFVYNGTAANVLGLKAMTQQFESIICAQTAHLNVDECGAPERFTGCKLIPIETKDGKLSVERIMPHLCGFGDQHHSQPKVISITQPTELGTVYTKQEIRAIANLAHKNNMLLHMDGARIANAVASLNIDVNEITRDAGVDVLSFGGTKNGMMFGEAVVLFNKKIAVDMPYIRKQSMQLASKMRFIAVQFEALLSNDLWLRNAKHANKMAQLLANEVKKISSIRMTQPVQANGVFASIPRQHIPMLQKKYFFYVWNETTSEVRWMTSFDTTEEDIHAFVALLKKIMK